jgi:pimeloyl-ACP methyl ester carboxylesterase
MKLHSLFLGLMATLLLAAFAPSTRAGTDSWIEVSHKGSGPALLFIPGLASSKNVWADTAAHLKDRYSVYQVQVKGFAGAPADPAMYKDGLLDGLSDALAAYIRNNNLDHPVVIGHSMGGYLALRLERDHGDLISKVMVVDALPFYSLIIKPGPTEDNMKPMAAGFKAQVIAGAKMDPAQRRPSQRQMLTRLVADKAGLETVTDWGMNSDANVVGQAVYELMTSDLRGDQSAMKTPTLVLTAWEPGGRFNKTQTKGFWAHHYAPHKAATVEVISPARHFIMLDQPKAFMARLDAFLAE